MTKKAEIPDLFAAKESKYEVNDVKLADGTIKRTIEATLHFDSVDYRAYLNRQLPIDPHNPNALPVKAVKLLYRGAMSIINPQTNRILELEGIEKKNALQAIVDKRNAKAEKESDNGKEISYADIVTGVVQLTKSEAESLKIRSDISASSDDEAEIKRALCRQAKKMHDAHAVQLMGLHGKRYRPGTIPPGVAASLYLERYIGERHGAATSSNKQKAENAIKKWMLNLPNKPMAQFSHGEIKHFVDENKISQTQVFHLRSFWGFCISEGLCQGTNPFPAKRRKKKDSAQLQEDATHNCTLTSEEKDAAFKLLEKSLSPMACGVALQLGGGIPERFLNKINWGRVSFFAPDFCVVYMHDIDFLGRHYEGATHNYSFVLLPQAARVLHNNWENITQNISVEDAKKQLIVTDEKGKKLTHKQYETYIKNFFASLKSSVGNSTLTDNAGEQVLIDTYTSIIENDCGIPKEDAPMKKYYEHQSVSSSTTLDYYLALNGPDAFAYQKMLFDRQRPSEPINKSDTRVEKRNKIVETRYPKSTGETIHAHIQLVVQPGGRADTISKHAITGPYKAYKPT